MIQEGYHKFKDSIFQVRRIGTDILIIPPKYVDEIRKLSGDNIRSVEPFINDFAGEYTRGLVFLQSDLQNRVIQQKLTPTLSSLTSMMKEELDLAIEREIPEPEGKDEWMAVDITAIFVRIISRISARVFLGPEDCRNEEWLETTAQYTENLFLTGMILRVFPRFLRPLVAALLPSHRGLLKNVAAARQIIGDIVHARNISDAQNGFLHEKRSDVLQWMMEAARGEETETGNLSQRMLILSLSSIHTTALTMTQALYDLCDNAQYFEPLRQELTEVLLRDGGWQKTTLNRFYKLDSLLKESQRFCPVFLLTFNRIFHKSMRLSDGTIMHAGTRVAVPSHSMLQDPSHVPGPSAASDFDPFRYSKLREDPAHPENSHKFLFSMTDSSNMAFGYGKYACPGRFYASNEMKLVLAHLLLRYDFKLPAGSKRPRNFTLDSDMFPDPRARLYMRQRQDLEPAIAKLVQR
ncbi:uncharacterized protein JN550_002317 [Neoarthrinium moseri]|uniref:uncharacterized protein n=1 Tax=Neoarthrinium moseri TaxID=1658444 RepID=UPI001FDD22C2|nr:uncharacterized protein JN550_002317 [Neoarthrinium moseri]KAI1874888.1 hypothetical protein JN550_002317 [Neoarthrinium moseri]